MPKKTTVRAHCRTERKQPGKGHCRGKVGHARVAGEEDGSPTGRKMVKTHARNVIGKKVYTRKK